MNDAERRAAYRSDITYGTNNEFGFDYLRDNMKFELERMVQRGHVFAIVDEVDSILIDEARTPLIISGPSEISVDLYYQVDAHHPQARQRGEEIEDKHGNKSDDRRLPRRREGAHRGPHRGGRRQGRAAPRRRQPLRPDTTSRSCTRSSRRCAPTPCTSATCDYIVKDGQVIIVDEFTGRLMPGRRWSDGLHQAVEAKEGVKIEPENQTLATITLQNYFRMYEKLAGMTGTAETEAEEFAQDLQARRRGHPDQPADGPGGQPGRRLPDREGEVRRRSSRRSSSCHEKGQPVLVGTVSIEKSEKLSELLKRAEDPSRGAERQVPRAGGRDRRPGGRSAPSPSPPTWPAAAPTSSSAATPTGSPGSRPTRRKDPEEHRAGPREVPGAVRRREADGPRGGRPPHPRHRAARGAAHRQPAPRPLRPPGRPGSSRFFLSLEDDLMRIFGVRPAAQDDGPARAWRRTSRSSRGWCRAPSSARRSRSRAATSRSASTSSSTTTS